MASQKSISCQSGLGAALRQARVGRFTQAELAKLVNTTQPAIAWLEDGKGGMGTFLAAIAALEFDLSGRGLPPGETLGERFKAHRKRQGISLDALAKLAEVTKPTLIAMERDISRSHLRIVERVAKALSCELLLAPTGAATSFYAGVGNSSNYQAWQTPQGLLEQLYRVFGDKFGLDPCSPTVNPKLAPVRADEYYKENALSLPWKANTVFTNPPYNRGLKLWIAKAHQEYTIGNSKTLILLIPARTDTKAWHAYIADKAYIVLLQGRLSFSDGTGSSDPAPFPSSLIIFGPTQAHIDGLRREFPDSWHLPSMI
ncbi:DNA N-6-adenine-methyltransferase [Propionivibrio sp.]|uniref:DNA N-6-adenine-methyltransferase n=1 Tax=Propionivibrio sp. TaxID=2212460 RepID=UPI003BF43A00